MGPKRKASIERAVDVLQERAKLGVGIASSAGSRRRDWAPVKRMIAASQEVLLLEGENLRGLLEKSSARLFPLADPLLVDFGAHEWLSKEPEPAYSGWLQWIVKQLPSPELVFRLFGLKDPEGVSLCEGISPSVKREDWVPEGHEGQTGRLDLTVRYPGKALIVVEVKKISADEVVTVKQRGYKKSLGEQRDEPKKHTHTVLLAVDAKAQRSEGDFLLLTWGRLCIELRRMVPDLRAKIGTEKGVVVAAMILAFVGAVEQNLCGLSSPQANRAMDCKPVKVSSAVTRHIEESLRSEDTHGYISRLTRENGIG